MVRNPSLFVLLTLTLWVVGCGGDEGLNGGGTAPAGHPGTEAGAKALLGEFLAADVDAAARSAALRPRAADYEAVFVGAAAAKAAAGYKAPWDAGRMRIAPKAGQTELLLWSATSEDLQAGAGNAAQFPGGYKSITSQLRPGVTWYRFKFVKPGEPLGMAFDGLVHVNGHWAIFPKPWRVLR